MTEKVFITIDELAARWLCTAQSLRNLKSQGKLPVTAVKLGGMVRFRLTDVIAAEASSEVRPATSNRWTA